MVAISIYRSHLLQNIQKEMLKHKSDFQATENWRRMDAWAPKNAKCPLFFKGLGVRF